ncbi:MAG: hypothetical protein ACRDP6_47350 [Actinoallomurus sp.]
MSEIKINEELLTALRACGASIAPPEVIEERMRALVNAGISVGDATKRMTVSRESSDE